ncbi:c-type cytochrome [Sphingosinicella ginsenosidimutans]|uniref:c-type cytochrome n=1 Tax=Allosphingosinicella ginsenosidimutans TaxID=1176539 RepID=UPI0013158EBF|nr:cytochrome c [Sphingosinicella ginsenosidimutans]
MRALILLAAPTLLAACHGGGTYGDVRQLIAAKCGACHRVPGVNGAVGRVGPSLAGIGQQQILAGHFANSRANMIRWISRPQEMLPGNAMPDTGLTPEQANRIADYLYAMDR